MRLPATYTVEEKVAVSMVMLRLNCKKKLLCEATFSAAVTKVL